MGIGPILPGRLPSTLQSMRFTSHLAEASRLMGQLQDQIATGQRFFLPSEAPAAAVRTISFQKLIERKEQMQTNVMTDRLLLSASETSLASVSEALNQAKSFVVAGIGDSVSSAERQSMAQETATLITQVLNAANTTVDGRYLFAGSQSRGTPFELVADGTVRYNGDGNEINSFIDLGLLLANNVDGKTAFGATTTPVGSDIDPALTLETRIADLYRGEGVELGSIVVTVDDLITPQTLTQTVDLTAAETIGDIKTILEDAFAGILTVNINPANNGLQFDASAVGTVAVSDVTGSNTAANLGVESAAVATITGGDLDPRLTLLTNLSDLNGGAGISVTPGQGLLMTIGNTTAAIDISDPAIQTVEDLFNTLKSSGLDLDMGINEAGNGLAISSRLSGVSFSIGENGDTTAADLGIRTLDGSTLLADLNLGMGVAGLNPDDGNGTVTLEITRRDSQTVSIDISNATTFQDVIDAIDADAGLQATLNAVGNGITITDLTGGTGSLIVEESSASVALGIDGVDATPGNPLVGEDVNPLEAGGVLNILLALETALRNGDDVQLNRIAGSIDEEVSRFNLVRGELGARLKTLDDVENRLLDEEVLFQKSLSEVFDTNMTEAITQLANIQVALEATLQMAATTLRLSLFSFL